jgi:hypothetical protein
MTSHNCDAIDGDGKEYDAEGGVLSNTVLLYAKRMQNCIYPHSKIVTCCSEVAGL